MENKSTNTTYKNIGGIFILSYAYKAIQGLYGRFKVVRVNL